MPANITDDDASLRERIAAERLRRGWTQKDVADQLGMSLRAYSAFENGRSQPHPGNMRAILNLFSPEAAPAVVRDPGEVTREEWPIDIKIFCDMMGAFLATMPEEQRLVFIHEETRRIVGAVKAGLDQSS